MQRNVVAAVTVMAIFVASAVMAATPWQQVRTIGQLHFIVVEPASAHNAPLLERAAASVCPGKQACFVTFWSDAASVPSVMPMTKAQQQSAVAQYLRNPVTGKADLLLKCPSGSARNARCLHSAA